MINKEYPRARVTTYERVGVALNPVRTSPPKECVLWKSQTVSIEQIRRSLTVVTTYEDDSHLIRTLTKCNECGHMYFHEFYEEIDWHEGKDAQYFTWIPVDDEESARELSKKSTFEILSYPSIRYDFPKGIDVPYGPAWNVDRGP